MEQAYEYQPLSAAYGKKPSFAALVTERFSDELISELKYYSDCNKVEIIPCSIQKIIVTGWEEFADTLYFHVLYDCIQRKNGTEREIVMVIECCCHSGNAFEKVITRGVFPLTAGRVFDAVLPDDLVPSISKAEMDHYAAKFINALYPKAAEYAVPVGINTIVRKLRLTVEDVPFDPDGGVLGKIFFEDTHAAYEDPDTGIANIVPVTAGTIFVNRPPHGISDAHVRNNTVLHECLHWILHRPAFTLSKIWNRTTAAVACRSASAHMIREHRSSLDWMEWQANSIAPRILMPDWATRYIANGWLRRYNRLSPILRMERTIDRLSQHFEVTRQLAKIRMEELGYEDAKSAFAFYEKKKHTITFANAVKELSRNQKFREILCTGIYEYVDECFIVRDKKYIIRDESGILHLAPYAKSRMDECCLSFASRHFNQIMQYSMARYSIEDEAFLPGSQLSQDVLEKRTKAVSRILKGLPASFSDTLIEHMARKKLTIDQLAERCLMSHTKLSRIRRDYYASVNLKTVIALCIGLKLHPVLAMDLVRKAGYCFTNSFEHTAYQFLLLSMTNSTLYECNEYLQQMGIGPLGNDDL